MPQKDHETLIRAFACAINRSSPEQALTWRLRIAGDGPLRQHLNQVASAVGVADRFDLLGQLDDVFIEYKNAAIFVLPSRFEGSSNALAEAANAGLACVVTEEVVSEKAARNFSAGDADALSNHLVELMAHADRRRTEGDFARECLSSSSLLEVKQSWARILDRAAITGK